MADMGIQWQREPAIPNYSQSIHIIFNGEANSTVLDGKYLVHTHAYTQNSALKKNK